MPEITCLNKFYDDILTTAVHIFLSQYETTQHFFLPSIFCILTGENILTVWYSDVLLVLPTSDLILS